MVNNLTLRLIQKDECQIVRTKDAQGEERDKIMNGPVYDLALAKIEAQKRKIFYVTKKAAENQYNIMKSQELKAFIDALQHRPHYRGSERCETSMELTPPPWSQDSDAYAMKWNIDYGASFGDSTEYYLKFGFQDHDPRFLVVSLHT